MTNTPDFQSRFSVSRGLNRRHFLTLLGLGTLGGTFHNTLWSSEYPAAGTPETIAAITDEANLSAASVARTRAVDANHVVLVADTHCGPGRIHQLAFMRQTIADILACEKRPGHVLIFGDFAFLYGKREDYQLLQQIIAPLTAAGIPWTNCMGNHDRREYFKEFFPEQESRSLMKDRLVFRVETPFVDFLMLDSLVQPVEETRWITPGEILPDQRDWLNEQLKSQTKPVFLGAHHPLNETKLEDIIKAHSCVAGYIHGHNHYWAASSVNGLPVLTLPSNGHWGDIGLVNAALTENQALFTLTMRDYVLGNRSPDFEPNPQREAKIAEKRGAKWCVPVQVNTR